MAFVKIENGVVVQKQPYNQEGFIEAPDSVICGMSKDGDEYSPAPVLPHVPDSVDMASARIALIRAGLLDAVEAAVQAAGPEAVAQWEYRGVIRREAALVQQLKVVLNLTEQQLDELFTTAASL